MISEVYNIDCLEYMRTLPDNYFSLACVDPPYGIGHSTIAGKQGGTKYGNAAAAKKMYKEKDWDNYSPDFDYFIELKRVSNNQIVWGANHFISKIPLDSPCWVVWDKDNGDNGFSDCELAYTSFNSGVRKVKITWNGMIQHDMKNKEIRIHPTQKPVALYKWILQNYAYCKKCQNTGVIQECLGEKWMGTQDVNCEYCEVAENGVPKIFDSHMGSQSSRIAAYDMGFDYYGCELDKEYFDAGNKRFKLFKQQQKLF